MQREDPSLGTIETITIDAHCQRKTRIEGVTDQKGVVRAFIQPFEHQLPGSIVTAVSIDRSHAIPTVDQATMRGVTSPLEPSGTGTVYVGSIGALMI